MDIKKIWGRDVKLYRKKLSLNQEEFAFKVGISPQHLSNIEIGKRFVSADLIERIAEELEISPAALFLDENKLSQDDSIKAIKKLLGKEFRVLKKEFIRKIVEMQRSFPLL